MSIDLRGSAPSSLARNISESLSTSQSQTADLPARSADDSIRKAFAKLRAARQAPLKRAPGSLRPQPFSTRHIDPKILRQTREFIQPLLAQIKLPSLDASDKDAAQMNVRLSPESTANQLQAGPQKMDSPREVSPDTPVSDQPTRQPDNEQLA